MTHWTKITPQTREFTDESYMKLIVPSFQFYSPEQKAKQQKEEDEDEKARRHRDMEERRRRESLRSPD